jgi:uncharacterized membrane protein
MTDAAPQPPPPPKRWRLKFGDQVFGPYDRAELKMLIEEGRLARSSRLAEECSGGDWRPADQFAELEELFRERSAVTKAKPPKLIVSGQTADNTTLHVIYALYAASFLNGLTLIVGVIIAYVKRDEARGTWQASHYQWLIRTFWWSVLFLILGAAASVILVGFLIIFLAGVWLVWRIAKGWIRLSQWRGVENPDKLI